MGKLRNRDNLHQKVVRFEKQCLDELFGEASALQMLICRIRD